MTAEPDDWKRLPFGETASIPYRASFSDADFERIARGLVPKAMEDKWFAYLNGPVLCFHRSWTGQAAYRVTFRRSDGRHIVAEALCAVELMENGEAAYQAELLDFLIRTLLLGAPRPFPLPSDLKEPAPGIYQHRVAGTGYREVAVPRKPWWKFWG
ncbi:hypothetical protein [Methylobacterium bullatum]|uniref:Uncharacterized protein n=1 Tax=Methylobacterium bullatum TaxID=570505 RepID=A0AAV4Z881_9HYPH|nr:hypothetical protein [Methylobacterium bullatum]MBD8903463.1 hypothetical protein [Methylobacterium bullatum]GJD40140.1 hypothetical protein OICFNHDK_2606 [Methylobacterium bullatum]